MKNGQTGVECRSARLLCIIAALSDASRRRLPVPASAPRSRAEAGCFQDNQLRAKEGNAKMKLNHKINDYDHFAYGEQ